MVTMFSAAGSMVLVIDAWLRAGATERRWNAKGPCKRCGAKTSAIGRQVQVKRSGGVWTYALVIADGRCFQIDSGYAYLPCRGGCGRVRVATMVDGTVDETKPCNAKCMGACGPACSCSCGGKNHGKAFSL